MLHSSEPPNPWEGYRLCLKDIPECTHLLVVQDDVLPCPNFAAGVQAIAASNMEVPVCLFLGKLPSDAARRAGAAMTKGTRYVPLGLSSFMPLPAVLWPRRKAQEFLYWSRSARKITRADDGNAARWMKTTKQQILVAVPSLVQHNDEEPSVKGGQQYKPWTQGWRKALYLCEDAAALDW